LTEPDARRLGKDLSSSRNSRIQKNAHRLRIVLLGGHPLQPVPEAAAPQMSLQAARSRLQILTLRLD